MWFKKFSKAEQAVPSHVAIIMDGNGRWAEKRGLPRLAGHKAGVEALKRVVTAAKAETISFLTVYAFSTENWNRPEEEVLGLMDLIVFFLKRDLKELIAQGVRIRTIGDIAALPKEPLKEILDAVKTTENNTGLELIIALNYGGRHEIIAAAKKLSKACLSGDLTPEMIDETAMTKALFTDGIPDPDLIIRTSGEVRTSNFLLWQSAYAEYYFTDVLWPDFNHETLKIALKSYALRDRRFGKVKKV